MGYQDKYDIWHEQVAGHETHTEDLTHSWHKSVAKLLPYLQGHVLEIGCGRGDFSIWLSKTYPAANIVGVDFSEAAIAIAGKRALAAGSRAKFRVEDAQSLSFENSSFDYVISCECLEHVPEPLKMAKEIHRVLRSGGHFILTTENYFNGMILMWIKTWITGTPFNSGSGVQPHENFFLFWKVKKFLEDGGLKVEHMESNNFQWLMLPRTDPAKLAIQDITSPVLKRLFRPFGRHFTFSGMRQ
jgi:SAM-dependent methyltransferase